MKTLFSLFRKLVRAVKDNYFIFFFILIVISVGFITIIKSFTAKNEVVYAQVKISQGYWWASTLRPSYWLAVKLKKGDTEKTLSGKRIAEIQEVRYYPSGGLTPTTEQYDVYITVKLLADYNERTKKYSFKRSSISVGSPIDFEFTNIQISGTIVDLSPRQFSSNYRDTVVTLRKTFANSWEYEGIEVGDFYFDGKEKVLEVIDKNYQESYAQYNSAAIQSDRPINIEVKLKMRLEDQNGTFIYRKDTPILVGRKVYLQGSKFIFDQYTVAKVE